MKIQNNPTISDEVLTRIRKKWFKTAPGMREGIHLSDLNYCITKSYWQKIMPTTQPNDNTILTWVIGLALERVLLEDEVDTHRPDSDEQDSIHVSPDYSLVIQQAMGELKTTRYYYKKDKTDPSKGYVLGWIKQMAGYSYVYNLDNYMLAVFQIITASMYGKQFSFNKEERTKFWKEYIIPRRDALIEARERKLPPEPFAYNEDWECENCSFKMICDTTTKVGPIGFVAKTREFKIPESMLTDEVRL